MEGTMESECRAEFKYYETEFDSVTGTTIIQFTNLSEGDSLQYFWQFDNVFTSSEKEPRIKFDSKQAEYKVCLKVVGSNNCSDIFCDPVYIQNPIDSVPHPEECFTGFGYKINYDIQTFVPALVLDFYSKADPVAVEWFWDFDDGTTSTEENPTHIFNYPIILDSILSDPNPFREVCLTVKTISGCSVSYCETINVYMNDSVLVEPIFSDNKYYMKYESSFPIQMSSCAGYVKAQVYWGDSLINAIDYKWSHGVEGQEANGFCPTQTYSVKAKTPDGVIISGNFIFNSDGTVTEIPFFWLVSGEKENAVIQVNPNNKGYFVEWKLCDGTIITADSISFDLINCDSRESNMILKDSLGNVIYSENISGKSIATYINSIQNSQQVKLFPNPVNDVLNIQYSGATLNEMQIEIYGISGKRIISQQISKVESGQNIGVNVHSLQNGIYVCKIVSENRLIAVEKFTK
jgi:hypothetical protein